MPNYLIPGIGSVQDGESGANVLLPGGLYQEQEVTGTIYEVAITYSVGNNLVPSAAVNLGASIDYIVANNLTNSATKIVESDIPHFVGVNEVPEASNIVETILDVIVAIEDVKSASNTAESDISYTIATNYIPSANNTAELDITNLIGSSSLESASNTSNPTVAFTVNILDDKDATKVSDVNVTIAIPFSVSTEQEAANTAFADNIESVGLQLNTGAGNVSDKDLDLAIGITDTPEATKIADSFFSINLDFAVANTQSAENIANAEIIYDILNNAIPSAGNVSDRDLATLIGLADTKSAGIILDVDAIYNIANNATQEATKNAVADLILTTGITDVKSAGKVAEVVLANIIGLRTDQVAQTTIDTDVSLSLITSITDEEDVILYIASIITPDSRKIIVTKDNRVLRVIFEDRTHIVLREDR